MDESQAIVAFCRMLALVGRLFRTATIAANKTEHFADVSCTVSHSEMELNEHAERFNMVQVAYSLDSELPDITEDGKYSLGVSVVIFYVRDQWRLQGDVGWSCRAGWDEFRENEMRFASVAELLREVPNFVEGRLRDYAELIDHHFARFGDR